MIITKTPFRISFFGGGTDYPAWFEENGGAVLATAIDKYCYITCRYLPPFFDFKYRIVYSNIENVSTLHEIKHPAVRAVLSWKKIDDGLAIHHEGDLPARSGLGSSSSFTVGLIHALTALRGKMIGKKNLAKEAIYVEQNVIGEHVGSQDQISAAYGGFNKIEFLKDGTFDVEPVILKAERRNELLSHLMLFFTGFSRVASDIAKSKIDNFKNREKELFMMRQMVDQGITILQNQGEPIISFGQLLDQSWRQKRTLSDSVSNNAIDEIYQAALDAGATGGKLLGAGGGGFLLVFACPSKHENIRERLKDLIYVPFDFEPVGSQVVVYQPDYSH